MMAQEEQFAIQRGREIVDDFLEENPAIGKTRKLSREDAYEITRRAILETLRREEPVVA
jgi:hypothetical protein